MSMFKTKVSNGGGEHEVPPDGQQKAVLVGLIDLGTHQDEYQGTVSTNRKVFFVWELTEAVMSGTGNRRHTIGREFNYSLGKKANLRKFMESWRAKDYQDGEEVDISKVLGQPCMLTIKHKQSANGNVYAQVDTCARPHPDMKMSPASVPTVMWELESGTPPPTDHWLPFLYSKEAGKPVHPSEYIGYSQEMQSGEHAKPAAPAPAASTPAPKHTSRNATANDFGKVPEAEPIPF